MVRVTFVTEEGTRVEAEAEAGSRLLELAQAKGLSLVPVLIADHGVPDALVRQVANGGFPAAMLDTQDKREDKIYFWLLDCINKDDLQFKITLVEID